MPPLQILTKRDTPFNWSNIQQVAFDNLKHLFTTAPELAMWHEGRLTVVETDATGWAVGGHLSQFDSTGNLYPVAYYSKKLSLEECNYDIHGKAFLLTIRCI